MRCRIFPLAILFSIILGCVTTGIKPPNLLEKIEPEYPREAEQKGQEGRVEMYLLVTETGDVELVTISKSSGYKILDDAATDYAKKLKFDPARKKGRPINVWLSWLVNYKAIPVYFVPNIYVGKVQDFFKIADQFTGEEKERILQEIIYAHEDYVRHIAENPHLNYNMEIRKFVMPEVYERWKDMWQDWPLSFVVFHDFVLRYPSSEKLSFATARLVTLIKKDIERIKETARYEPKVRMKKDMFLKTIYTFLNEEYLQAITQDLKAEAERYLIKR